MITFFQQMLTWIDWINLKLKCFVILYFTFMADWLGCHDYLLLYWYSRLYMHWLLGARRPFDHRLREDSYSLPVLVEMLTIKVLNLDSIFNKSDVSSVGYGLLGSLRLNVSLCISHFHTNNSSQCPSIKCRWSS